MKSSTLASILLLFLQVLLDVSGSDVQHNYYWRDYSGYIPEDAVNGTADLYVAQAYYEGILVGTLYPDRKVVVTERNGQRKVITHPIKVSKSIINLKTTIF